MRHLIIFLIAMLFVSAQEAETAVNNLAPAPPMGWNSWDCFGTTVTEDEVKANADYMAEKLSQYGWQYIVVDIQWYEPNAKAHGYRENAELITDEYGRLLPASNRFPSSEGGKGFKSLADYIHNLGLKFGIHIMRGIPKQAVRQNLPVKGTDLHARDIADTNSVCPWNTDMFGVRADTPGGQAYYDSIVELYKEWGVDYIKADDMAALNGHKADENRLNEIKALHNAIVKNGRPIVLSLSPGPASVEQADFLAENAQLWRISDDFWDKWTDILKQFDYMREWQNHIGPASWPDADMLPIGKIGIRAERGENRFTHFTEDEQYTLITLWSMFRSPLMFGGNLPGNDDFTLSLITNGEVMAVNQNSSNNREVYNKDGIVIWTANVPNSDDIYAAVFNINDESKSIALPWENFGIENNTYGVRDLWTKTELGEITDSISFDINAHGAKLIKLTH